MDTPPPVSGARPLGLHELRSEIDRIDDALHDLLIHRAGVVERVGRLGKTSYRPGREADVIRRLLARHSGPLPARALARCWREIFAANIAIETAFVIAAWDGANAEGYAAVAREHFGALTPLRRHHSAADAIGDVAAGSATAAVLPLPRDGEAPHLAWWVPILLGHGPRVHVVARLPFWASPRGEGAASAQALVVAAAPPDPSGRDRSLLALTSFERVERTALISGLQAAGMGVGAILRCREADGLPEHVLADVDGYLREDDPRLSAIEGVGARPLLLGGYADPVRLPG